MARADFDLSLHKGQVREQALLEIFRSESVTIEVKSQVDSEKHVFIEHSAWGKPSGIAITKADYWAIEIYHDWWVILRTVQLKNLYDAALAEFGERAGGDDKAARGAIVPKEWLANRPHCPNR